MENQSTFLRITEDELGLNDLLIGLKSPTTGALVSFTGFVRQQTPRQDSKQTQYLEYEAYQPMAEEKMAKVAAEMRKKWPALELIFIHQRVGKLEPGTPTILIACSSAHRDSGAFEAVRYAIDRIKEIVPIWKKETSTNGAAWVRGHYFPDPDQD